MRAGEIPGEAHRARAEALRARALVETLPNVRANFEAAAQRWIAMAEQDEAHARQRLERRLAVERDAHLASRS